MHALYYCECIVVEGRVCNIFLSKSGYIALLLQQQIFSKSPYPKYPFVHQLDNGSNSTNQLTHIPTSNMKIGVGPLLFGLFDFSTR